MNLRVSRMASLVCAAVLAGTAAAEPTHYVVFAGEPGQPAQPVFYALVDRAADAAPAGNSDNGDFRYRPLRAGVVGAERLVERPLLRAEFARDPEHGDLHIEMRQPETTENAFLLRLPVAAADAIQLEDGRIFDLDALARDAAQLPLAGIESRVALQRASSSGPPGNRVDILVLGDGYTAAQAATFATHAEALRVAMFDVSPNRDYANLVNWTTGFVTSNQSGADHPPYLAGCSQPTCCADSAAIGDPRAGQFPDTALDARFCTSGIHRLLTTGFSKTMAAAAAYANWDQILVTVNDPVYGGAGGSYAVTSADPAAPLVVIHEYGHSFTRLADEYTSPYPGYPACSDITTPACEANATNQTNPALIKWAPLLTPGILIPTPSGTAGTGLFEGARYLTAGMYRPTSSSCLMRSLGTVFCRVCAAAYVRKLYSGGFGVPAAGIDLIEPGTESPSAAAPVAYSAGSNLTVGATVLVPALGSVTRQWLLDGVPIAGANGSSYVFNQASTSPATRTLQLRVIDNTGTLPATMAGSHLEHTRSWTINVSGSASIIFRNGFE